jgi:hypothetical protein
LYPSCMGFRHNTRARWWWMARMKQDATCSILFHQVEHDPPRRAALVYYTTTMIIPSRRCGTRRSRGPTDHCALEKRDISEVHVTLKQVGKEHDISVLQVSQAKKNERCIKNYKKQKSRMPQMSIALGQSDEVSRHSTKCPFIEDAAWTRESWSECYKIFLLMTSRLLFPSWSTWKKTSTTTTTPRQVVPRYHFEGHGERVRPLLRPALDRGQLRATQFSAPNPDTSFRLPVWKACISKEFRTTVYC